MDETTNEEMEMMDAQPSRQTLSSSERTPREQAGSLRLHLQRRVETFRGSNIWDVVVVPREIPVTQVAVLLCDVWDNHWCRGAVERLNALVPRMEQVVSAARRRGVQIIHAPSETMDFYAGTPYRQRIQAVPRVEPPEPLALDDPLLPIDASDGGCDTGEKPWYKAWTRQHPAITICGDDVISDNGREIYSFLRQRGIDTLIIMGVHTNMCVLNRSFGIKQMTRWGIHCVLVRDLTDAMYNPQMPPYVSHDEGTALVIEYIEKYWCPTILSQDLLSSADSLTAASQL
jgi:nicotinamidase-related amidase